MRRENACLDIAGSRQVSLWYEIEYQVEHYVPPEELKLVVSLQARLKARSKVEVVRGGLRLLQETTERDRLREAYRRASLATRKSLTQELKELDALAAEGLD
jgi:hypothetical protein